MLNMDCPFLTLFPLLVNKSPLPNGQEVDVRMVQEIVFDARPKNLD